MIKKPSILYPIIVLTVSLTATNLSRSEEEQSKPYFAVPTYECIGVYYRSEDRGDCKLEYRKAEGGDWRESLGLVYDSRDKEYRGSLVYLEPDTLYDIRLTCGGATAKFQSRTKSDRFPIGKITSLNDGVSYETVKITESGTPEAYHLITPATDAKTTLDMMNAEDSAIVIDADYVIVRGVECRNAARHGILIERNRHDIVIEDCHVSFWGRMGGPLSFGNDGCIDSAIYANKGAGNLTLQRNLLENPRGASNDWDTGHPNGPQGISLIDSSGGNVIRYNEILTTEDHGFNDGIGGASNFSFEGSPNCDSDIYGNIVGHVWDDAIESEGANMNVRIWGNYLHHTYQHIAIASTSKGPLYIFRNVFGVSRKTHNDPIGGSMIKVGQRDQFGGGRRFVFHNTALQPNGAFNAFSGHINPNTVTRNNIFDCPGQLTSSDSAEPPGDFDYDLFTGMKRGVAQEPHGIRGKPAFIPSYNLEFYPAGSTTTIQWGKIPITKGKSTYEITDPVVTVPNPIVDSGVRIPGFNDDFAGKAPDLGAFELGRPPLRFGRRAQGNIWAPWELK